MRKIRYILNGNQLYQITSTNFNILTVQLSTNKLIKADCRYTYDSTQLETLGFIIQFSDVRGCVA